MLYVICYLIALIACTIGAFSGMGGGVIIKPVLDATGMIPVTTVNFLSGCTVIAMSAWSVGKTFIKKESTIELKTTSILGISAAVGGVIGKILFNLIKPLFENQETVKGVQACVLFAATFATLIYTINKDRIKNRETDSVIAMIIIGFALGALGSFLGIGGGPFNVAALTYFFAMPMKKATQNSLFIVLCSQIFGTGQNLITNGLPDVKILILIGMIVCGILGSEIGRKIHRKIDNRQATMLFEGVMILILCINVYNIIRAFAG
ncbi:MAG: sulfite exporter TauE/SafE family protein [Parasporobacterium sp.]|nr:sulfite exporter TauE/SafE family protein [Parasporobacterium sp.]